MKLKKVLALAFTALTIIPALLVLLLLYKSGFELSKESYTRNLTESINVQTDFLSQTIESNMISDSRFIYKFFRNNEDLPTEALKDELLSAVQYYLESAEDRTSICILLNHQNMPLYTIGEADLLDHIQKQLPELSALSGQKVMEFTFKDGSHSLGIVTPVHDSDSLYQGAFISVYDKSYLLKIISSYYKLAESSIYMCSEQGDIVNLKEFADQPVNAVVAGGLEIPKESDSGAISIHSKTTAMSGYYKNIHNTPWYLAGIIDQSQIFAFTNQFIWIYALIIIIIIIAVTILSITFSQKVVEPINHLIQLMDGYPQSLNDENSHLQEKHGYFETQYLQTKFLDLMKTIMMVQHNFEGVYQLYQSNNMGDINIDIDVINQTIHSNKDSFSALLSGLVLPPQACIVERFTQCFCDKDQLFLMNMFEGMRDEHLSVTQETEVYTPHFNQKWFHILVVPMYEEERLSRLFIQLRDISSFKKHEYESMEQAKRDPLTGLLNRSGFATSVEQSRKASPPDAQHGILFLDMNHFKLVNDNFGHVAGDELLRNVATIIMEAMGPEDIVSRFGGDEFALFIPCTSQKHINRIKENLEKRLIFPYSKENTSFVISVSIGASIWEQSSATSLEEHLNEADIFMYQAKRDYKKHEGNLT